MSMETLQENICSLPLHQDRSKEATQSRPGFDQDEAKGERYALSECGGTSRMKSGDKSFNVERSRNGSVALSIGDGTEGEAADNFLTAVN